MSESQNEEVLNMVDQMRSTVFNMQTAEYKGDKEAHDQFNQAYSKLIKSGQNLGISDQLDIAETEGRLQAAMEENNEVDINFFTKQLEEKRG